MSKLSKTRTFPAIPSLILLVASVGAVARESAVCKITSDGFTAHKTDTALYVAVLILNSSSLVPLGIGTACDADVTAIPPAVV